ncbi:MFS transporter [Streptomyces sp. NRRL B-24484]|uniref:MFS transporter n=1 Tax=Streptomyces sp. NRRL B-24484 TaxID=1463833 RepID=UPI0004C1F41C|nr:MFS transporter [Streptomyces sp. NRRL B-24484]
MLSVLRNRTYRHLFAAQVVALVGTGLATVALALLAYDLAGADAGAVLGTALAIKMVAYVAVAPVAGALAGRVPQRALMVAADLTRAGTALALPFVGRVWQVYLTVFLLQAASALFTPTFQATVPRVLPAERDYTGALSLSRLAYDLESLFSPALAALLLTVVSYDWLFAGTVVGFLGSAALVVSAVLPKAPPVDRPAGVRTGAAFGSRLFLATPRLRALLALDLAVAAAGAIVFVDTVLVVREHFHRPAGDVSLALGAYGAGSMAAALLLPRVLVRVGDRAVMLAAALVMPAVLTAVAAVTAAPPSGWTWSALLAAWALVGAAGSAVLTPGGRVIRRSAGEADLPAAFAAQFSLSHSCWLLTYPLAGWLAAAAGLPVTALALGVLALAGAVAAAVLWPRRDPDALRHEHTDLPAGHPHLVGAAPSTAGAWSHGHHYVIDEHHHAWPRTRTPARTEP